MTEAPEAARAALANAASSPLLITGDTSVSHTNYPVTFRVTLRIVDGKPSFDPSSISVSPSHYSKSYSVSPPWSQVDRSTTRSLTIRAFSTPSRSHTFNWMVDSRYYEVTDTVTAEGGGISVTLRNLHGKASYDPSSIRPAGTQAEASPAWGNLRVDEKRTITLTASNGESVTFKWCGGSGCTDRQPGAVPTKLTVASVRGGSNCTLTASTSGQAPQGWRYIWRNGNSTKITDGGVKWTNLRNTRYWVQVAPYGGPHNPLVWSDRTTKVTVRGCP